MTGSSQFHPKPYARAQPEQHHAGLGDGGSQQEKETARLGAIRYSLDHIYEYIRRHDDPGDAA